jgi:hypothetical protein
MKSPRTYTSAGAFRTALEDRLRAIAGTEKVDTSRLRRQVAFDRLLARLFRDELAPWALKGGYALEIQLKVARATVDIDLALPSAREFSSDTIDADQTARDMLQAAAGVDLGDWFAYTIGAPIKDLDAAPYGGARYPVEARMDARIFARFHLDVGIGDIVMMPPRTVRVRDWLDFAGIPAPEIRLIPREQQVAEKLHAYTLPRSTPNSRAKDLVDLILLIRSGDLQDDRLREAVRRTFERRRTHSIPADLPQPPEAWTTQFQELSKECGLQMDIEETFSEIRRFFGPIIVQQEN